MELSAPASNGDDGSNEEGQTGDDGDDDVVEDASPQPENPESGKCFGQLVLVFWIGVFN